MPRRGHKKSRAGCDDCKRRHMKCDESRPSCVNCQVASLTCSYTKSAAVPQQLLPPSSISTPAYSPLTPEIGSNAATRRDVPSNSELPRSTINMDHLELLHHYETMTYQSFVVDSNLANSFRQTVITNALQFPFLMYAILALSAIHLCRIRPDRADHYHQLAASLQAIGLAGLKDTLLNITTDNCVAIFIFSTTTGMHSFCETFTFRHENFNTFLDKLTSSIRLMRGVRSVMAGGWWQYLSTSVLADLLASGNALDCKPVEKNKETGPLWELLEAADLGPSSIKTYEEAITDLQRVFNAESHIDPVQNSVSMVFAWPVMLSSEYNDLLIQRRPEALVILAYYGAVLHRRRAAWAVGDSGQVLIRSISDYLGSHWERWLRWPIAMITATPAASAAGTPR